MEHHHKRHGRLARWLAVLALTLGAFPAAAGAACLERPTSTAFAAFEDTSDYFLASGGDFEGTRTWWSGGRLMEGNEPFLLAGADHGQSLRIDGGATAVSPSFCADASHPDFRFVARPLDLDDPGALRVYVRFKDRWGGTQTWAVHTLTGIEWTVTPRIGLMRDLPLPYSGTTSAQLLFRAVGADWAVDDVFIDPYRK